MNIIDQEDFVNDAEKDFEGNYIEKFDTKNNDEFFPGKALSWEQDGNKVLFIGENASLELTIISNTIIKVRYGIEGYFEDDFSYAIDPNFVSETTLFELKKEASSITIITAQVQCQVDLANLKCTMFDARGKLILSEEKGFHWKDKKDYGGNIVVCTKKTSSKESFFGLGDKTGKLNRKGTRNELWGTDCYGYSNETDPVYKNIPFYLGLNQRKGYGIFFDNTFRTFFDFAKERKNVTSFWAHGGEMRYYFIYGPNLIDVSKQYTTLTGKPKMPPKWSLGYHQSKWSYYPEKTVRELADTFRKHKIPCDVIHLDIDYMDGYRCFTWDKNRFPHPQKMVSDLKKQGFKSIVIIDPGIKIDKNYTVYQEGIKGNYFCKRMDGDRYKGSVWPELCHFPDFTNPKVRTWWSGLFKGLVEDGIAGIWNDMNEPATFETGTFPNDVRHDYDGHPCSHRKAHNVYGSLMAKATNEGQQLFNGNKRSFTITRSAYAGVQRDSSVWTGDNSSTWEHLTIANIQCQRLAASGVSFTGSDVGGFVGSPDGELYTRWIQMAVFHPFFRTHSSGDHGDKEPWVFEDRYTDVIRKFIEFRYQLLPYIYATFWQYANNATPMLRSLHLHSQFNKESHFREEEFLLGDHLLVCPVSQQGATKRQMYVPRGNWYNYWTDEAIIGRKEITVNTPLDQIPLFIRAGAIIPMQPVMQYVDEFEFETLDLHVYKGVSVSQLYEDDGETTAYQKGHCSTKTFKVTKSKKGKHIIKQQIDNNYLTTYNTYQLVFHGFKNLTKVTLDKVDVTSNLISEGNLYKLIVPKDFKNIKLI